MQVVKFTIENHFPNIPRIPRIIYGQRVMNPAFCVSNDLRDDIQSSGKFAIRSSFRIGGRGSSGGDYLR